MAIAKRQNNNEMKKALNKFHSEVKVDKIEEIESTIGKISVIEAEKVVMNNDSISEDDIVSLDIANYREVNLNDLYAAPLEWNLWDPQDDETKLGLMESIYEFGVLQNIIVWEVPSNIIDGHNDERKYMILAGHNRVDALRKLNYLTQSSDFSKLTALVYQGNDLSESKAKRIIDDTNLLMRTKSPKEIGKAYIRRIKALESDDKYKGYSDRKIMELLAAQDEKSRSYVRNYVSMANCIDEVANLVGEKITLKSAVKFSALTKNLQEYLYQAVFLDPNKKHLFNDKNLMKIRKYMLKETLDLIFVDKELPPRVNVSYEIDPRLKNKLDEIVRELINSNKDFLK